MFDQMTGVLLMAGCMTCVACGRIYDGCVWLDVCVVHGRMDVLVKARCMMDVFG